MEGVGIHAVIRGPGEVGGGGGGKEGGYRRPKTSETRFLAEHKVIYGGQDHRVGAVFYRYTPPAPPNLQLIPAAQVGRSDPSGAGASIREELGLEPGIGWIQSEACGQ